MLPGVAVDAVSAIDSQDLNGNRAGTYSYASGIIDLNVFANSVFIEFSNLTDWTFFDSGNQKSSEVVLGQATLPSTEYIQLTNTIQSEYVMLGVDSAQSVNFLNFSNTNVDVRFSTLERGVVLPQREYARFSNLLAIASQGDSFCPNRDGDMCILPNQCSEYPELFQYNILLKFVGEDQQVKIPLAVYAQDSKQGCKIFIERSTQDTPEISFGIMTFQSLAYYKSSTPYLALNSNFVDDEYFGSSFVTITDFSQGENAFSPLEDQLQQSETDTTNSLPAFVASFQGLTTVTETPYFYIDFTQSTTFVWDVNCVYMGKPCLQAPLLLKSYYLGEAARLLGTFE
jgi:hypothetical protein